MRIWQVYRNKIVFWIVFKLFSGINCFICIQSYIVHIHFLCKVLVRWYREESRESYFLYWNILFRLQKNLSQYFFWNLLRWLNQFIIGLKLNCILTNVWKGWVAKIIFSKENFSLTIHQTFFHVDLKREYRTSPDHRS